MWESHLSQECNAKTFSPEVFKPPFKYANCGLEHTLNYKGFLKFPIKPQFRESHAKVAVTSKCPSEKKVQKNTPSEKIVRNNHQSIVTKIKPPTTTQQI